MICLTDALSLGEQIYFGNTFDFLTTSSYIYTADKEILNTCPHKPTSSDSPCILYVILNPIPCLKPNKYL